MSEELLRTTAERALRYLRELPERGVAPEVDAIIGLERFDEPLPDGPTDPERVIALLDEVGSPATMAMAGPAVLRLRDRRLAARGRWRPTGWPRRGTRTRRVARPRPVAATLEQVALRWLVDLFGLPLDDGRGLRDRRDDGQLHRARGRPPRRPGAGRMERRGARALRGAADHGDRRRRGAPVAAQGARPARPRPARARSGCRWTGRGGCAPTRCPRISGPTIVCVQAGNVNTGAFDPIEEICARAHEAGAWVHVDGAFGLWAAVAPARAHLVRGVGTADSWATDAHKWLNVPYDSGLAFVRDPAAAARGDGRHRRVPARQHDARARRPRARALAPRARRRGLGRAPLPRALGPGRPDRAQLPPRAALRRGAARRPASRS